MLCANTITQTCSQVSEVQIKTQVFKVESKSRLKSLFYLLATALEYWCHDMIFSTTTKNFNKI